MSAPSAALRRSAVVLGAALAACSMVIAVPGSANAVGRPIGGCAGPHMLQPITDFSSGTQSFLTASIDKNLDGYVCTKPLPDAIPFLNISFTDNVAHV